MTRYASQRGAGIHRGRQLISTSSRWVEGVFPAEFIGRLCSLLHHPADEPNDQTNQTIVPTNPNPSIVFLLMMPTSVNLLLRHEDGLTPLKAE